MCAMHSVSTVKQHLQQSIVAVDSPDRPPTSIFFRFFASRMTTVSLPAVGTQRREKQMSPSFSCYEEQQRGVSEFLREMKMFVLRHCHFPMRTVRTMRVSRLLSLWAFLQWWFHVIPVFSFSRLPISAFEKKKKKPFILEHPTEYVYNSMGLETRPR